MNRLLSSHKKATAINPAIRLTFNEYDLNIASGHQQAITDANGNRVLNTFDWRGNVTLTDLAADDHYITASIIQEYDGSGFLTAVVDQASKRTESQYFDDGSVKNITNPELEITHFQYDLFGNKAKVTKAKGESYSAYSHFDTLNRLEHIADANGQETRFEYDSNDSVRYQYMPKAAGSGQAKVEYTYDTLNQRLQHIQHKNTGNLTVTYDYDESGNLTYLQDAKGQEFTTVYDDIGRVTLQNYPAGGDIVSINTTYDDNGNVDVITETKADALVEVTDHDHDLLDRLTSSNQRGRVVSYQYDDNGNRTQVSSNNGVTDYSFDSRNRLYTATANSAVSTYQYFQNNWLDHVTYANQTQSTYTYDNAGRVDTIVNTKTTDSSVVSSFDYAYDANGNRTEQIEIQNGFATNQQQTTSYTYDLLDRMETYTIVDNATGDQTETVYTLYPSYDRETETVTETIAGVSTVITDRTYQYDETYWLTDITNDPDGKQIVYGYDNNGNTLSKVDNIQLPVEQLSFTYNSRDQLINSQRGPPGSEVSLGQHDYNYAGMRIRHLGSERGNVEYIYDGQSIIEEVENDSDNLIAHYRYGDRLLALSTPTDTQFYHFSTLGTTANLTDGNGDVQVSYRTDPFGGITHQEGTSVNRQVFTGQEIDEQTGLIYFGARFYDPDTARFINQDSYLGENGTPPSLHRYLYGYGNPTSYIDRDGHVAELEAGMAQFDKWSETSRSSLSVLSDDGNTGLGDYALTAAVGVGVGSMQVGKAALGTVNFIANGWSMLLGTSGTEHNRENAQVSTDAAIQGVTDFADRDKRAAMGLAAYEGYKNLQAGKLDTIASMSSGSTQLGLGAAGGSPATMAATKQLVNAVIKSKVVLTATKTIETALKAGGNRIAGIGKSAANVGDSAGAMRVKGSTVETGYSNAIESSIARHQRKLDKRRSGDFQTRKHTRNVQQGRSKYDPKVNNRKEPSSWQDYYAAKGGEPVPDLFRTHGHHIIFKDSKPEWTDLSKGIAEKYDIDWFLGKENIIHAPNRGHSKNAAKDVYRALKEADDIVGTRDSVIKALRKSGVDFQKKNAY